MAGATPTAADGSATRSAWCAAAGATATAAAQLGELGGEPSTRFGLAPAAFPPKGAAGPAGCDAASVSPAGDAPDAAVPNVLPKCDDTYTLVCRARMNMACRTSSQAKPF